MTKPPKTAAQNQAEKLRRLEVQRAIESLYRQYPPTKYRPPNTEESTALGVQIERRQSELAEDKKLRDLKTKLQALNVMVVKVCKAKRASIDKLMNRLRLRGVTEELLRDIEKLSNETAPFALEREE